MSRVATLAFDIVQGPQDYRLPAEADVPALQAPFVATTRFGVALGRVVALPAEDADVPNDTARPAQPEDLAQAVANQQMACRGLRHCRELVVQHELPMHLVESFLSLDRSQLTVFFTAPGRVDFRGLLRDVVRDLHVPIRLEQVGERDVARLVGGAGRCGRIICCHSWMPHFDPVSMKHVKAQDLPPVPSQLGGLCGKLRCCLRFELPEEEGREGPHHRCPHAVSPAKTTAWRWYEDESGPLDPD